VTSFLSLFSLTVTHKSFSCAPAALLDEELDDGFVLFVFDEVFEPAEELELDEELDPDEELELDEEFDPDEELDPDEFPSVCPPSD
jgi:hypothetical protein